MNFNERFFGEDSGAVSPVIGVILMVAITVILAAVIAAFVMDIGPGDSSVNAAVDVTGDGSDEVEVQLTDRGNADGVAIANASTGNVEEVITTTGDSADLDSGSPGSGDYNVFAYEGELTNGDNIDDDADSSSLLTSFEISD